MRRSLHTIRGALALAFRSLCTFIVLAAMVTVAAWLAGRILNDRYAWSQWLWWFPTPLILLCAILGLVCAAGAFGAPKLRRGVAVAWVVCGAAIFMEFAVIEHRLLRRETIQPASASALKVAHWNMQPPKWVDVAPSLKVVLGLNADVMILTDPGGPLPEDESRALAERGYQVVGSHPFALITRVPVLSMRTVVFVDRMHVVVAELDTTEALGRPITLYLTDLPSRPDAPRIEIARRVRTMLDGMSLPPPDMVVGDFNIPRGSASIATLFPGMRHAFNQAGHGYGATYPRDYPLWHIDHMLLASSLRALRYDIIDPGRSRHRLQVAWIVSAS